MTETCFKGALAALAADAQLQQDFLALCDCGGRRAGTASERAALKLVHDRLTAINPSAIIEPVPYAGWRCSEATLTLEDGAALTCNALLGSQSTPPQGISAEVIDLGRGKPEDFERAASDITGRFALVRHEYPFSAVHVHRRRKYGWAMEHGAAGFIIANPLRGAGPVSGSSGRCGHAGIPAVAIDFESATRLVACGSRRARVHLKLGGEDYAAETGVAILDLPGQTDAWVALSAHVDGHDLAESAMDNATGVVVVLAVTRALAPLIADCRRGLKVCLFSAEEWALAGSREYLDRMSEYERSSIALNINLDTVGGDAHLTALTSEFPCLDPFVRDAAASIGIALDTYAPMMPNSDHYNFARHAIPALRLVAGFNRPECNIKYILTRGDTRDKVKLAELQSAATLAATLLMRALTASDEAMTALRQK
jgi:aminopeptidase YwaD